MMTKLQMSEFELSQSYLAFFDKLEKANFFLERIIELRDKPLDDRSLQLEMQYLFGDGGWYHYYTGLINKYGVVPKSVMPETKQSSKTGMLNKLGKTLLRKFAGELRAMNDDGKKVSQLRDRKDEQMFEVYKLLVYNYGKPPAEFSFRYEFKEEEIEDKDSTEIAEGIGLEAVEETDGEDDDADVEEKEKELVTRTFTPKSFFNEFYGESIPEYIAITNIPTKKFNQLYDLKERRNIYEDTDFKVYKSSY